MLAACDGQARSACPRSASHGGCLKLAEAVTETATMIACTTQLRQGSRAMTHGLAEVVPPLLACGDWAGSARAPEVGLEEGAA